jgi:hypothetical protein
MDEKVKQAFETANFVATFSNQRRIIQEELSQKLVYYINGGTFKVTLELINFAKTSIDLGHTTDVVFIDQNKIPVLVNDVQSFLDDLLSVYFEAVNDYHRQYADLKRLRQVESIAGL